MLRRILAFLGALRRAGGDLGQKGERIAERHIRRCGLRIVERNARAGRGEIDIVALDGDVLVFVEVKCRRGRDGDDLTGLENVDSRKREALRRTCRLYRKRVPGLERWRLDVVTVRIGGGGQDVRWYPGAIDLDAD